jgi:hypothetical protein
MRMAHLFLRGRLGLHRRRLLIGDFVSPRTLCGPVENLAGPNQPGRQSTKDARALFHHWMVKPALYAVNA